MVSFAGTLIEIDPVKRSYQVVKPSFRCAALLTSEGRPSVLVPCEIWIPRHNHERPYVRFESLDKLHEQLRPISQAFDFSVDLFSSNGGAAKITARKMFLDDFAITNYDGATSAHTSFGCEPEFLSLESFKKSEKRGTEVSFYISDNVLLQPHSWTLWDFNGDVKLNGERFQERSVGQLGQVKFQDYYYYIDSDDGGVTRHKRLSAYCSLSNELRSVSEVEAEILPCMRDYLLLCALAADQRTHIFSWEVYSKDLTIKVWYGDISEQGATAVEGHADKGVTVPHLNFDAFIARTFPIYSKLNAEQKELVRQSIYRVLPSPSRTVESSILSLFSAIESMVLLYRRETSLEFTVPVNSHWKKLEKAIKNVVRADTTYFPTEFHMDALLKMLPQLKRVPLDNAFTRCILDWSVDLSDMWSVFSEKPTLAAIRNRLVHGGMFLDEEYDALFVAMDHLEIIAQRIIISFFGYDVADTNISQAWLLERGWVSYKELDSARRSINQGM